MDNNLYLKNEYEVNRLSAKILLNTIPFLVVVYILEYTGIFLDYNYNPMKLTITFLITAITVSLPSIPVFIFKVEKRWVKYFVITMACIAIGTLNSTLSKDVVILWVAAASIGSLYFSRKMSWFALVHYNPYGQPNYSY